MTDFYRDSEVRRAEGTLRLLREVVPDAVVLGGWAVYLYAEGQRSIDVDIAVDFAGLGLLRARFGAALTENSNLRKYEVRTADGVEIDIFVMRLSNAVIPIEECLEPVRRFQGFRVVSPEGLLALKLCAWIDRVGRPKGDKDESDVLSLVLSPDIDWDRYREIIDKAVGGYRDQIQGAIRRLVTSSDMRGTWRFVKVHGSPLLETPQDWKRAKDRFRTTVPAGL